MKGKNSMKSAGNMTKMQQNMIKRAIVLTFMADENPNKYHKLAERVSDMTEQEIAEFYAAEERRNERGRNALAKLMDDENPNKYRNLLKDASKTTDEDIEKFFAFARESRNVNTQEDLMRDVLEENRKRNELEKSIVLEFIADNNSDKYRKVAERVNGMSEQDVRNFFSLSEEQNEEEQNE